MQLNRRPSEIASVRPKNYKRRPETAIMRDQKFISVERCLAQTLSRYDVQPQGRPAAEELRAARGSGGPAKGARRTRDPQGSAGRG